MGERGDVLSHEVTVRARLSHMAMLENLAGGLVVWVEPKSAPVAWPAPFRG